MLLLETWSSEKPHLSMSQAAAHLDVTQRTVDRWMDDGVSVAGAQIRLEAFKKGANRYTTPQACDRFVRRCTGAGEGVPPKACDGFKARAARARKRIEELLKPQKGRR